MGFVLEDQVEPLDYDLGKYGGKGTIPEPSDADIEKVQKAFLSVAKDLGVEVGEKMTPETMARVADKLGDDVNETMKAANARVYGAIAELCKGKPTLKEIEALPVRVRNAFIGWLMGQFNPEAQTAGTKG